jgi:Phosphatase
MTRRPRRDRPPLLDDPEAPRRARDRAPAPATPRGRLVAGHVAGAHSQLGRAEVAHAVARVAARAPDACLGLDLGRVTRDEAWAAVVEGWGWAGDTPRAQIDPDRTLAGVERALERVRAVGARGGRVAVATGRPASLLPLATAFAAAARAAGAELLACEQFGPIGAGGGRLLWWQGGVAVVTDGETLLADDGLVAGPEWLFATGRPDLVVADRGFAGAALAAGHEAVALGDLDAVALGLAAARGLPVALLPLAERCPPAAYAPLLELVAAGDPDINPQPPHSTTRAPGAYAAPERGGEG